MLSEFLNLSKKSEIEVNDFNVYLKEGYRRSPTQNKNQARNKKPWMSTGHLNNTYL